MTQRRPSGSRGFALLIVLWTLGGLALVGAQITAVARTQARLATAARDRAVAEAAADGAVRQAMFILLGGGNPGTVLQPTRLRIGEAVVDLAAEDEAAKINPNAVSRDAMRDLLTAVGVDPSRAARLAGQIADWRSRDLVSTLGGPKIDQYREHELPYQWAGGPFTRDDEVGLVPDMTPEIMARLLPWLSVYQEGEVIGAGAASPAASVAAGARLSMGGGGPGITSRNVIMRVTAAALVHGQARFVRSAVIRVRASLESDAQVQLLTWE